MLRDGNLHRHSDISSSWSVAFRMRQRLMLGKDFVHHVKDPHAEFGRYRREPRQRDRKGRENKCCAMQQFAEWFGSSGSGASVCHFFRMSDCPPIASKTATTKNFVPGMNPQRCRLYIQLLPKQATCEISLSAKRRQTASQQLTAYSIT